MSDTPRESHTPSDDPDRDGGKRVARLQALAAMLPEYSSLLDVGARDASLLAHLQGRIVGFDLVAPLRCSQVPWVRGDACRMPFRDKAFDVVVCVEVLEHLRDPMSVAAELSAIARTALLIGVPYHEDLRAWKLRCHACGRLCPAYGHLNSFDEARLDALFEGLRRTRTEYWGETTESMNAIGALLLDAAGRPYGPYDQVESCPECGSRYEFPRAGILSRGIAKLGEMAATLSTRQRPTWIHCLYER